NLSAQELMDDDVLDQVERALATSGLPPERLHIEITESTMISSPERVRHLLSRFRELGVRVAIDDFGTGYSSLAYLKDLPVDILKIDRSFVSASDEAERNAAILRAIVELGHSLDLKVTAEGIESETQLERLRDHGVEQAQGFLLGRPMPAEDFLAWLRARS
ncbi:MAG TPA: EAL domain-containing protein, partial [Gammaproteobacteria bacterium]|nr:EAL domain-containing protein [Gammaproteobacteria bacterium]